MFSKEIRVLLGMIIVCGASAVALVQYTDICRLNAVTINGEKVRRVEDLGLLATKPIVFQPVDSLADALMTRRGITKVDIDYKLPNSIRITTNELEPVCYLLDSKTGIIYGVEESGRVVPCELQGIDWNAPLFTGVAVKRLHEYPPDGRVMQILNQMRRLKETEPRLYREIEEIDLSRTEYATLVLANKPYRLKLQSEEFAEKYIGFDQFMMTFRPETDSVTSFDLTYTDMIIRQGYTEPKEKPVIDTSEVNDKAAIIDDADMLQASISNEIVNKRQAAVTPAKKPAAKSTASAVSKKKSTGKKSPAVTNKKKSSTGAKGKTTSSKSGTTKKSTSGKTTTKGAKRG
ncbi:MAG: hypothetical protein IPH75_13820 [bacterium]|nr:hypothetical protein [bacterium]